MNRQAGQDIIVAAVLAALAAFVLFTMSGRTSTNIVKAGEVTATTLPLLYGAILLFLTAVLAGKALYNLRRPGKKTTAFSHPPKVWARIAGTLILLTAYVALLKEVPFLPLTAVFLAAMFVLYGHRRWLPIALVAGIGAVALDVLFIRILSLPI